MHDRRLISTEDYKNAGFYHVFSYHYFYPCCPEESQGILDLLAPLNRLHHLLRLQHEQHCVAKKIALQIINVSDLHRYLGYHQSSCSVTTSELYHKIFRRRF